MFNRETNTLLRKILKTLEEIMSQTGTGLAALQAFITNFQAFAIQMTTDQAALTTAVNNAIALLNNSEDPAVQNAVTQLQTSLTAIEANEAALEGLTSSLTGAENPAPQAQAKKAT